MLTDSNFGRTVDILERSMSTALLRRSVIANNVSNAETPNFKRSEVSFESRLFEALRSESKPASIGVLSHPEHISFDKFVDYRNVRPKVSLDYLTKSKNNGNNVDIERESMQAAKNEMMYDLLTKSVNHQFRLLNIVLG